MLGKKPAIHNQYFIIYLDLVPTRATFDRSGPQPIHHHQPVLLMPAAPLQGIIVSRCMCIYSNSPQPHRDFSTASNVQPPSHLDPHVSRIRSHMTSVPLPIAAQRSRGMRRRIATGSWRLPIRVAWSRCMSVGSGLFLSFLSLFFLELLETGMVSNPTGFASQSLARNDAYILTTEMDRKARQSGITRQDFFRSISSSQVFRSAV